MTLRIPMIVPTAIKTFILCVALLVNASSAAGQQPKPASPTAGAPSLGGTVVDYKNKPVPDVMVLASNVATGLKIPAKTDAKGGYLIPALPPGSFRVSATKPGYSAVGINTVLLAGQVGVLNFTLTPGDIIDHTSEAAGKGTDRAIANTPRAAKVVEYQEREEGVGYRSTVDALQQQSAVGSREANPVLQGPIVRGLDSSRVVTMIDGQRLNSTSVPLPTTLLSGPSLDSVELLPGASSTLHGSGAIGGTVNLVTEKPKTTNQGHMLDVELDGAFRSNGASRSGAVTIFYTNPWMGLRLGGFLTRQASFTGGGEAIPTEDVLKFGRFYAAIGNNPALYPIFSVPENAEIQNGAAHGSGETVSLFLYATPTQSFQYNQMNVHQKDIGTPFTSPPLANVDYFSVFVKIDKYSLRYEAVKLNKWLSKISAGFYGQKFTVPNGQFNHAIVPGSSFRANTPPGTDPFTGNPSQFKLGSYTENKYSVTSYSPDVQVTLTPLKGMIITTGGSYLEEITDDEYYNKIYDSAIPFPPATFPFPDFIYKNRAGFAQVEYTALKWIRLAGGIRVDNWRSEAQASSGVTIAGFNSTETSRNISAMLTGKYGISPYVRWEKGFREPSIGDRVKAPIVGGGGNNIFEPESANDIEFGVKVQEKVRRSQFSGSVTYFHNHIHNFYAGDAAFRVQAGPVAANALFAPEETVAAQQQPSPPPTQLNQVVLRGVESSFQMSIPLSTYGSISPSGTMNWLHGTNLTPIAPQLAIIRALYNRTDTPVKLEGSEDDVPQALISPFQGTFGAKYVEAKGRWTAEYNVRYSARVTRVAPFALINLPIERQGPTVFYGTYRNLDPFTIQSVRTTYSRPREKYKLTFSFAIENLTNRLFWEHFTSSPSPGRSFNFGMALNFADLLRF